MINGTNYVDHKDPTQARRKQESNFFLTINSNKPFDPSDNRIEAGALGIAVDGMEHMLKVLAKDAVLATYLKFGPKNEEYAKDKYADVIHSVNWNAAVERGDKLHRVHAHVWLTITHYSQVQINVQMLMYLARAAYNDYVSKSGLVYAIKDSITLQMQDMPYVHVKLLPQSDWTSVMRNYIHKGMAAAAGTSARAPGPTLDTAEI
jgi:hypothetical protein